MGKEFPDFKFFPGKSFYRAHPGQVFFGYRIEGSIFLADSFIYGVQFPFHYYGNSTGKNHSCRWNKRQSGIQMIHAEEDNGHMDDNFNHKHAHKRNPIADTVNIILNAGHQFSSIGPVKKVRT